MRDIAPLCSAPPFSRSRKYFVLSFASFTAPNPPSLLCKSGGSDPDSLGQEKTSPEGLDFSWLGMRDSNPRYRDQNPVPYHLANPHWLVSLSSLQTLIIEVPVPLGTPTIYSAEGLGQPVPYHLANPQCIWYILLHFKLEFYWCWHGTRPVPCHDNFPSENFAAPPQLGADKSASGFPVLRSATGTSHSWPIPNTQNTALVTLRWIIPRLAPVG